MNPLDWGGTFRSQQRNLDSAHQTVVDSSMETASGADNYWDTHCNYPRYTVDEPQSMLPGVNLGSKGLCPPLHNSYDQEVDLEDPSGKPFETDEDPELRRKREELREIEEQIIRKKVSIALKTVKPLVEETSLTGFSSNEQSATCKTAALKDRVNAIIQQRHPVSFLSKVHYRKDRMNSSSLSKDGLLQEDHPLKLRVKALMMQRCRDPHVLPTNIKVPCVTPPPLSQIVTSPAKEENSVDQGFQRFLSVLNKGVDMDLLSRIVNDDSEDLPLGEELLNIQPLAVENKSDLPLRGESPCSNSCAFLLGHSRSNSRERKTDLPSQERYLNDHVRDDNEKKNEGGVHCFGSSSRSKSPPPVKKKRKKKEEEKPNVDNQHADLQNILKTLGFSLEVEEMSKLADRTQERLYGKKQEGVRADSRGEQESQQRDSHRQHRSSSSSSDSSFSSSSSRSTSRSVSPSPPHQRRTPEHSSLRDRSRDRLTYKDSKQDSKEAQRHRDGEDSKETSTYQHPYLQNQMYPHPHPVALSPFPDYSSSQYSQYFNSGTYNAATNSYWTYTQDAIPPSRYPTEHPYPQNTYQHFPTSVSAPTKVLPHQKTLRDVNLLMNPDLSKSEGQTGATSGPRCLKVIPTKQLTHQICLKQLTSHNTKRKKKSIKQKRRRRRKAEKDRLANSVKKVKRPQGAEDDSNSKPEAKQTEEEKKQPTKQSEEEKKQPTKQTEEEKKQPTKQSEEEKKQPTKQSEEEKEEPAEHLEEEKKQPTEEEIKMNLRKKLEAFNQMVKQKLTQSAL
ncbi:uncharacterized protein [Pagrus major]|uniref:uncharacterized protein isoform X1 n=1 Tax=Pagrus major TaxID=143350 RepID=UPI003CC88EB4